MENVMLKMLDSKNIFGTMNSGSICLSNITSVDKEMILWKHDLTIKELESHQFTSDDKKQIFDNHWKNFGEANGFYYKKKFMMDQDLEKSGKRGSHFEITNDYVEANPKGWTDIAEDILIITYKVPGVAIGYPVADCPVVIMEDIAKGVTAVAHCSGALIDSRLPMMMADALNDAYQTKDEDIRVKVGPMAGRNWTYTDNPPKWAHDYDFWLRTGAIIEKGDEFKINLQNAITSQLEERNINNIIYSSVDTITDNDYYSNSESSKGNQKKYGRQFVGAIYQKTR